VTPLLALETADRYVGGAYLVFLLLLLIYVAIMAAKLQRIQRDLSQLADLADRSQGQGADRGLIFKWRQFAWRFSTALALSELRLS